MGRKFIKGQVAIDSMRDNGFLSAAHALAELIDNSIQAQADRIELIVFESKVEAASDRERAKKSIDQIAVFDNGEGMSPEILNLALEFGASENKKDRKGIGKFGMGLPNSSISQCKHVDVWSWRNSNTPFYTYLDIDEIKSGKLEDIPTPVEQAIPRSIVDVFGEKFPKSGTLVLWSKIDRCQWKTANSIFKHTQDSVGRMYRYFLNKDKVTINFKSAEKKDGLYSVSSEEKFLPNDPLYLIKTTSLPDLPGNFKGESMFEMCDKCCYPIEIADENGKAREVRITGTVLKKSVLDEMKKTTNATVGRTSWGKHAAKNMGVSIVRADRELSLALEFISSEARLKGWARFYGIEMAFNPALDNIFGVTNNKQHVVNLKMMTASEDYEREGFESEQDYRSDLLANNDPKLRIYEVVRHIKEVEKKLIEKIRTYSFEGKKDSNQVREPGISVDNVTATVNIKDSAREEVHPTAETTITRAEIEEELSTIGAENVEQKAKMILDNKLKVWVEEVPIATNAFFDVSTKKGLTLLQINSNHVFTIDILNKLPQDQRDAIEICLAGWARMERECSSERKLAQLQMVRRDWGQLLEDYLDYEDIV